MNKIDFPTVITKFDKLLARGLCEGVGTQDGQMCIEAAVACAMDLPFNDEPSCVEPVVRTFKIGLNDARWSSPEARAKGLRDLGIAQIGSAGVVDPIEFTKKLSEKMIRVLIPHLFRQVFPTNTACLEAADLCEKDGTASAAYSADRAARAARAADSADRAADSAAYSADSAARAADSAAYDKVLSDFAEEIVQILVAMKAPGAQFLYLTE